MPFPRHKYPPPPRWPSQLFSLNPPHRTHRLLVHAYWRAALLLRFAGDPVAFAIKLVDVFSDDPHRTLDISRTVPATASTVDVTSNRNAGTLVIGVAV